MIISRAIGILALTVSLVAAAQQSAKPSDEQIAAQNALTAVNLGLGACVKGYAASQALTQATPAAVADAAIQSCNARSKAWRRAFLESARLEARDNKARFDEALAQKQAAEGLARVEDTLRQIAAKSVVQMRTPK